MSKLILLTDFWYISNYAFKVTLNQKCVRNLSKPILLTYLWYISNSNFRHFNHKCVRNLSKPILLTDFWYGYGHLLPNLLPFKVCSNVATFSPMYSLWRFACLLPPSPQLMVFQLFKVCSVRPPSPKLIAFQSLLLQL